MTLEERRAVAMIPLCTRTRTRTRTRIRVLSCAASTFVWLCLLSSSMAAAFSISGACRSPRTVARTVARTGTTARSYSNNRVFARKATANGSEEEDSDRIGTRSCWNPSLRRVMGGVAVLGVGETAFLTAIKLSGNNNLANTLCGTSGSCGDVLNGPYATLPFTQNFPLSAVGCLAYSAVAWLALSPLLTNNNDNNDNDTNNDSDNRIALLALTTTMGTFSVFLVSLLFGVLHASCAFCLASAALSATLAGCSWLGGTLPEEDAQKGLQSALTGVAVATFASVAIFATVDNNDPSTMAYAGTNPAADTLLVSSAANVPPTITKPSSDRALALSKELKSLDARMFGAYWCSHCYDQKELFGKEAMQNIGYIECASDGLNSQAPLCKSQKVPGYPTWQIGGKLFPGEMELEELEDIAKDAAVVSNK